MRVNWLFKGRRLTGHEALIGAYPETEFNSPWRSTIPLIEYWRSPKERVLELTRALGLVEVDRTGLDFEHMVSPPRGRGKASHTDVMVTSPSFAMAIEAKWTERKSQVIRDWLDGSTNKAEVLRGWCDLLEQRTNGGIDEDDLAALPYQMIHRAASVCHEARVGSTAWLTYMVFQADGNSLQDCLADLQRFAQVLGPRSGLGIVLVECGVAVSNTLKGLHAHWENGARELAGPVRAGLSDGGLLDVAISTVHHIAYPC